MHRHRRLLFTFHIIVWPTLFGGLFVASITPKHDYPLSDEESERIKSMLEIIKRKSTSEKVSDAVDAMGNFVLPPQHHTDFPSKFDKPKSNS